MSPLDEPRRVIAIDPRTRTIIYASMNSEGIRAHVGGFFAIGAVVPNGDVIYVDDEGLSRPGQVWWRWLPKGVDSPPIAGPAVLCGQEVLDQDGDLVGFKDPGLTISMTHQLVQFLSRQDVLDWLAVHGEEGGMIFYPMDDGPPQVMATYNQLFADALREVDDGGQ